MKNLISLVLIALAIGLGFFYIWPQYNQISALRIEKSQYDTALTKAKELKTIQDSLVSSYNSISDADKAKLNQMIPASLDAVKLTATINALAIAHNLSTLRQVQISDQVPDPSRTDVTATAAEPYKTTIISFTTTGQYPTFVQFLKDLETSEEIIDVHKISISSASSVIGAFDFQVVGYTYSIQ